MENKCIMSETEKIPFTSRCPEVLLRKAKASAALQGKTIEDWVTEAIQEKLDREVDGDGN